MIDPYHAHSHHDRPSALFDTMRRTEHPVVGDQGGAAVKLVLGATLFVGIAERDHVRKFAGRHALAVDDVVGEHRGQGRVSGARVGQPRAANLAGQVGVVGRAVRFAADLWTAEGLFAAPVPIMDGGGGEKSEN